MKITPDLFVAHLKCPTKCWLRSQGEAGVGNVYADWLQTENEDHRNEFSKRLVEGFRE